MTEDLVAELRGCGPVSPAIQMRKLLAFGRARGWEFETAWRWSWERVRWPHDTTHRLEWKAILGACPEDDRSVPMVQRQSWRCAYEREEQSRRERSVGLLVAA